MGILNSILLLCTLAGSCLLRWPILVRTSLFYNSDTAILDLMARHFLQGELSLYYWGEHYYGVLDPLLLMALFKKWGSSPSVSLLLPVLLTPVLLALFYSTLVQTESRWTALWATAFLAFPSPYLLHVSCATYNYILGPLLWIAMLWLAEKLLAQPRRRVWAMSLGLVSGLSWYYFRLILFFWMAIAVRFLFHFYGRRPRDWIHERWQAFSKDGFWRRAIGLEGQPLPALLKKILNIVNVVNLINLTLAGLLFVHGDWISTYHGQRVRISFWDTLQLSIQVGALTAAVVFWRALWVAVQELWKKPAVRMFLVGFLIGYSPALIGSLRGSPPASPSQLVALPVFWNNLRILVVEMIPAMFPAGGHGAWGFLYASLILFSVWQIAKRGWGFWRSLNHGRATLDIPSALVFVFLFNLLGGLWGTVHRDVFTDRYFLPLYMSLALGFAWGIEDLARRHKGLAAGVLLFGIGYQAQAANTYIQSAAVPDSYLAIDRRLEDLRIHGGYADYWVAYRLTAFSQERLVIAPTGSNDRYAPYLTYVRSLPEVVLLDANIPQAQDRVSIKGIPYEVVRRESVAGMSTIFLSKTPSKTE